MVLVDLTHISVFLHMRIKGGMISWRGEGAVGCHRILALSFVRGDALEQTGIIKSLGRGRLKGLMVFRCV